VGRFQSMRKLSKSSPNEKCLYVGACSVTLMLLSAACKPLGERTDSGALTVDSEQDATLEILTAQQNTSLKTRLIQSIQLEDGQQCPIPEGTLLTVDGIKPEGVDHWRVFNLSELKLPSGEIARRARTANEAPSESVTAAVSTPPSSIAGASAIAPDEAPASSPAQSQPQPIQKTPSELLNCSLVDGESFLVFSPHFSRKSVADGKATKTSSSAQASPGNTMDDFQWQWPTRGRTIRNDSGGNGSFNAPRASGRGHQGIDIVAAVGEPVLAARAGTIVDPAWEGSYGKVVDLQHAGGYLSRYAHLSSFSYSHGSYVEKGARIAAAGRTGNASGYGITPHLHFEIRRGGRLLNPKSVLP